MSFGLEIDTSADCHCLPKWFKHTAVNDAKEPDLNKRCCKHPIPVYTLEIYPPEPKEGIEKTILATDNPAGPQGYNIPKEADVTVILYNKRKVVANHSFRKGELKAEDVEKVVADLSKILPAK
jgi:hypothetical protein